MWIFPNWAKSLNYILCIFSSCRVMCLYDCMACTIEAVHWWRCPKLDRLDTKPTTNMLAAWTISFYYWLLSVSNTNSTDWLHTSICRLKTVNFVYGPLFAIQPETWFVRWRPRFTTSFYFCFFFQLEKWFWCEWSQSFTWFEMSLVCFFSFLLPRICLSTRAAALV